MTIGVMSDTHGNMDLMNDAAALMLDTFGVTTIFHLGDDYQDSVALANRGVRVITVPGIYDKEYNDPAIPKRVMEDVGGTTILAAHAEKTIPQNEVNAADVILVGHTHVQEIRSAAKAVVFNPGHLKSAREKGQKPTFGIIALADDAIQLAIYELSGELVRVREIR